MAQQDLLELARKGDPQAIADLMNRSLQPKGIIAKVSISGDCLMLTTEAQQAPEQVAMVDFVRKGMASLNNESIKRVIVRGQAAGSNAPKWRETLNLNGNNAASLASPVNTPEPQSSPAPSSGFVGKLRSLDVPAAVNSLLLSGILVTTFLGLIAPKKPAAVQWEYRVEGISDYSFESTMRTLGEQGWELASARRATSGEGESTTGLYEVIFKRPTYISEGEIAARDKAEAEYAKQVAGRTSVRSMLLAEQSHYLENDKFTDARVDLGLSLEPETEDYKFAIAVEDPTKVVVTGTAKNNKFKSYTGAVYLVKLPAIDEMTTLSILCETDKASQVAPGSPQVADGKATCPSGSSEVKS